MASPVSIGDIIAVCTIAYRVYDRCKSSVTEFRELSLEVANLQVVLTTVESFWKRQQRKGNEISQENGHRLAQVIGGCRDVLEDLDRLLDKHRGLYAGKSFKERMKWTPREIGPIRNRIVLHATLLASINATITAELAADNQEKAQAQILQAVTSIHKDEWHGVRGASTFSQATIEDVAQDDATTWNEITNEIETAPVPVDRKTIDDNRAFIKNWIMKVKLEDVGESEEYDQEQTPVPIQEKGDELPKESAEDDDLYGSPQRIRSWVSSQRQSESEYETIPEQPDTDTYTPTRTVTPPTTDPQPTPIIVTAPVLTVVRTPSYGSHRSKASDWKLTNGPNHEYVEALLTKLLKSGETPRTHPEHITLVAKRVFHQMDYPGFGYLFHSPVKDRCWEAIRKAGANIDSNNLSVLIRQGDKDEDNKIDCEEFVSFIKTLLTEAHNVEQARRKEDVEADEARYRKSVEEDDERGARYMQKYLENGPGVASWNWKQGAGSVWQFAAHDSIIFRSTRKPLVLNAFENMRQVANHFCTDALHKMFETWGETLAQLPREEFDEYKIPFQHAFDVAAKFSILGRQRAHELDDFDEIVGYTIHMLSDADVNSCPIMELRIFKDHCSTLLRSLLGLVMCLQQEVHDYSPLVRVSRTPPTLQRWRELRVQTRTERLMELSEVFGSAESILGRSRRWFHEHSEITTLAFEGITLANRLHTEQVGLQEAEYKATQIASLRSENDVYIEVSEAGRLPKSMLGGTPTVYAKLSTAYCRPYVHTTDKIKASVPRWSQSVKFLNVRPDHSFRISVEVEGRGRPKIVLSHTFFIDDIVEDLSIVQNNVKAYPLYTQDNKGTESYVSINIVPCQTSEPEQPPDYALFKDLPELMTKLVCTPSPENWKLKEHTDGRTYFEETPVDLNGDNGYDEYRELNRSAQSPVRSQPSSPRTDGQDGPQPSGGRAHLFRPSSAPLRRVKKTAACYVSC